MYDDGCPRCSAIAQAIEDRDPEGLIALVPFSEGLFLLARAGIERSAAPRDVWFLAPGSPPVRGVAVLGPVSRRLPRWRRLAPLLRAWPIALVVVVLWLLLKQLRHEL